MTLRWRLFPKYATLIIALVGGMLVASAGISLYFSYRENREHLVTLQTEKAQAAASRIEDYVAAIEHQIGWTTVPEVAAGGSLLEQRRLEYLKLLHEVPAITEVKWIDGSRIRLSDGGKSIYCEFTHTVSDLALGDSITVQGIVDSSSLKRCQVVSEP